MLTFIYDELVLVCMHATSSKVYRHGLKHFVNAYSSVLDQLSASPPVTAESWLGLLVHGDPRWLGSDSSRPVHVLGPSDRHRHGDRQRVGYLRRPHHMACSGFHLRRRVVSLLGQHR